MEACCQGNHHEYRSGTDFQVGKKEVESIANGQRLNESHPWDETAIKIQNGGDTEGFQVGKPEPSMCQQARPQSPWGSTLVLDLAPCSSVSHF